MRDGCFADSCCTEASVLGLASGPLGGTYRLAMERGATGGFLFRVAQYPLVLIGYKATYSAVHTSSQDKISFMIVKNRISYLIKHAYVQYGVRSTDSAVRFSVTPVVAGSF